MSGSAPVRGLEVLRAAYGVALLAAPEQLGRAVTGERPSATATWVIRALGARHVLQAAVTARARPGITRRLAAAVDVLHLASLGPIALLCTPRERRLTGADAVVEAFFAAAERRHDRRD